MKLSEAEILGFQEVMTFNGIKLSFEESQQQAQTLTKLLELIMKYED